MSIKLTCREIEGFILEYLEGDLPIQTRLKFEFHILMCRECRQYLRDYRIAMKLGKQAFSDEEIEPLGPVPEDLIQAILAAQDQSERDTKSD